MNKNWPHGSGNNDHKDDEWREREPEPGLATKIFDIEQRFNEFAIGWNDSGCYWWITFGPRGAGHMIHDIGGTFMAETDRFEDAIDLFIEFLKEKELWEQDE